MYPVSHLRAGHVKISHQTHYLYETETCTIALQAVQDYFPSNFNQHATEISNIKTRLP